MPLIKRYSNRKLYDTEARHYVTLEDLADFVRRGEEVRVVDHATGEDLTSVTLFQVIFEEEKKIGGLLPQVFLTRLIRAGGETVSVLRGRLASLDPFQVVDEEIRRRVNSLVQQGRLNEDDAQRIRDLLIRPTQPQADVVHIPVVSEDELETVEEDSSAEEVETLLRQVELLERELEALKQSPPAA